MKDTSHNGVLQHFPMQERIGMSSPSSVNFPERKIKQHLKHIIKYVL